MKLDAPIPFASGFGEFFDLHKHLLTGYLEHYFSCEQKIQGVNELFCFNILLLIGRLSHYLQGLIHPRSQVVQDFFHQQYYYRQALGCAPPPTIGFLTNQLLGILPTNYWVSYQPTIGYLTNQLLGVLPTNLQHSFYQFFPPLGNPCF